MLMRWGGGLEGAVSRPSGAQVGEVNVGVSKVGVVQIKTLRANPQVALIEPKRFQGFPTRNEDPNS